MSTEPSTEEYTPPHEIPRPPEVPGRRYSRRLCACPHPGAVQCAAARRAATVCRCDCHRAIKAARPKKEKKGQP